ncbi:hypothetical protein [uncultured Psychrosphaera sp.]|uniref:hypothetical protein n=1 Tax=uncultured Psychrosphaera sp. TaxID=1403522 RepID=UPI0030F811AE
MSRWILLSSLLLLIFIAGCSSDKDEPEEVITSPLFGEWVSSCNSDDTDPEDEESSISRFTFTDTNVTITESIYSGLACERLLIEFTLLGTYKIGELVSTPAGIDATKVDFMLTEGSDTFGNQYDDYDTSFLQLFVIEGTYLYMGDNLGEEESIRPQEIDFSTWLEKVE